MWVVFTAEVTVHEAWSFVAKSIWGTVRHLTALFKLVNGFRQNSSALCKVALINLILSSNGNPVNCTQDGGGGWAKRDFGKGVLAYAFSCALCGRNSLAGRQIPQAQSATLPNARSRNQPMTRDQGKSQPVEVGQRPPKPHKHLKGRSRDLGPPQPGRARTRRPHRHLGCSSRIGTRRNWFLSTTASRAAAAISAQPGRTPKAARRPRESVPRLASLLTAVGHRGTES